MNLLFTKRFIFVMLLMVLFTACRTPHYECACSATTGSESYHTLSEEVLEEQASTDWCNGIQADTTGFDCHINEVKK